jgi:leucokinin receptor
MDENVALLDGTVSDDSGIYDIPSWLAIVLTIIYLLVSLCAVCGNWMVLWIVVKSPAMRNVTNLFIANLASADIIIGAFAIPFQFQAALLQKWLLPHFMCSFCPTVQVVSLNLSIFTLVALSVDRHRAITQPFKPRITKKMGIIIIFIIWVISIMTAIPTYLSFTIILQESSKSTNASFPPDLVPVCAPYGLEEEFILMYNHMLVCLQYLIPIVVISFAYIHMAIVLSRGPGIRNEAVSDANRVSRSKKRVSTSRKFKNAFVDRTFLSGYQNAAYCNRYFCNLLVTVPNV